MSSACGAPLANTVHQASVMTGWPLHGPRRALWRPVPTNLHRALHPGPFCGGHKAMQTPIPGRACCPATGDTVSPRGSCREQPCPSHTLPVAPQRLREAGVRTWTLQPNRLALTATFFLSFLRFYLFLNQGERRERDIDVRETLISCLSYTPQPGTHTPGMGPDLESNL